MPGHNHHIVLPRPLSCCQGHHIMPPQPWQQRACHHLSLLLPALAPDQVSPGRTHTKHRPPVRGDHGSISARLGPGTVTRGCFVPCAPRGPAGPPSAVEGAGGCQQLPRRTRIPPRGANSSAGGSYPSFPFRPRGTSAAESPGPKAASPETAAGTPPGLSIPQRDVERRGRRKWRGFVELIRSRGGPGQSPPAPAVTGRGGPPRFARGSWSHSGRRTGDTQPRSPKTPPRDPLDRLRASRFWEPSFGIPSPQRPRYTESFSSASSREAPGFHLPGIPQHLHS